MANVVHDAPHRRQKLGEIGRTPLFQRIDESILLTPVKNPNGHYITTLLSGYSTIPWAFACFSFGMSDQAACSSITVLTATHSPSAKGATVGFFNAGRSPWTATSRGYCTYSIWPSPP